jgi:hypothetical protein
LAFQAKDVLSGFLASALAEHRAAAAALCDEAVAVGGVGLQGFAPTQKDAFGEEQAVDGLFGQDYPWRSRLLFDAGRPPVFGFQALRRAVLDEVGGVWPKARVDLRLHHGVLGGYRGGELIGDQGRLRRRWAEVRVRRRAEDLHEAVALVRVGDDQVGALFTGIPARPARRHPRRVGRELFFFPKVRPFPEQHFSPAASGVVVGDLAKTLRGKSSFHQVEVPVRVDC